MRLDSRGLLLRAGCARQIPVWRVSSGLPRGCLDSGPGTLHANRCCVGRRGVRSGWAIAGWVWVPTQRVARLVVPWVDGVGVRVAQFVAVLHCVWGLSRQASAVMSETRSAVSDPTHDNLGDSVHL